MATALEDSPRWRRRKTARPGEIAAAALAVFAERGFAAAKLEDIARQAGLSKGALYLYFETKEDIFRAVVSDAIAPNLRAIQAAAEAFDGPFAQLAPMILVRAAQGISGGPLPAVAMMVIAESRNFPDLARIWHDEVVTVGLDALTGLIARAQTRGELVAGDPRLYAFSLIGPLLMGLLYRQVFGEVAAEPPDMQALAAQHVRAVLQGLLIAPPIQTDIHVQEA